MPTPLVWHCPYDNCDHARSRPYELWHSHKLIDHPEENPKDQVAFRTLAKEHSLSMERSQRNRVPTAKAAEAGKGSDAQVDLKSLPIVTPEYSDLPADGVFFESAAEIPKINPSHKVSSTTGEKIQLYHLGQQ